MKSNDETSETLVELGTASGDTKGGPFGEIELTGFIPTAGIISE